MAEPVRSSFAMQQDVRGRAQLFQDGAFNKGPVNARAGSIGGDVSGKRGLYKDKPQEEIEINRTGIIPNFFRRLFGMGDEDADMRNSQEGPKRGTTTSTNSSIGSSIYSNGDGGGSMCGDLLLMFSIFLFALTLVSLALESDPLELLGLAAQESGFALPEISMPSVSMPTISMPSVSMPAMSMPSMPAISMPSISFPGMTPTAAAFYSGATSDFLYFPYPTVLKMAGLY